MRVDLQDLQGALWARHPAEAKWHSCRKTFDGLYALLCAQSAPFAPGAAGLATLPLDTPQQFGPPCSICARLEGFD